MTEPDVSVLPRNSRGELDIDVYVRDTRTGRAIVHRSSSGSVSEHDPRYFEDWWWSEGNMACDCNRGDLEDDDDVPLCGDDLPCGHGRFVIDKITPRGQPTVILYSDAIRDAVAAIPDELVNTTTIAAVTAETRATIK